MRGAILLVVALAGCSHVRDTRPDPNIDVHIAKVPVATPCVVERPVEPSPLREQIPADSWNELAPGAKSQAVKAQAGVRMNYEDRLRASVAGCPASK